MEISAGNINKDKPAVNNKLFKFKITLRDMDIN